MFSDARSGADYGELLHWFLTTSAKMPETIDVALPAE